jgi:hypothetical protein
MMPISKKDKYFETEKSLKRKTDGKKRRNNKSQYRWTLKTLTQCSCSCGGGYQRVVPDRKCEQWNKPAPRTVRCNRSPCPAEWIAGEWGLCSCSVTCGEGMQERRVACRQELSESLAIPVAEELCTQTHNYVTQRKCYVKACDYGADVLESTVSPVLATQGQGDFRHQSSQAKTSFKYIPAYKTEATRTERVFPYSMRNSRKYSLDDTKLRNGKINSDSQVNNDIPIIQADWLLKHGRHVPSPVAQG